MIFFGIIYLSISPNNAADRHKLWFGVVKMAHRPSLVYPAPTDNASITLATPIYTNDAAFCTFVLFLIQHQQMVFSG
jgi:hypothetical protein